MIQIKRVYEEANRSDGYRVLVDRLWPRGVSKEKAKLDMWLKEIAPSDKLRKWFGHDPKKWKRFEERYARELARNKEPFAILKKLKKENKTLTLLFAARDTEHNEAAVLANLLS